MEELLNSIRRSWIDNIDSVITVLELIWQLPDPLDRIVLTEYYFCHQTERQIAEGCKVSTKTIYRIKKSAISKLEKMHG